MKLTGLETVIVDVPMATPIRTAIHQLTSVGCVLLTLRTDQGVIGESYLFTMNGAQIRTLEQAIQGLWPLLEGEDPDFVERVWEKAWRAINFIGQNGVALAGLSAVDMALWDIKGKTANLPLHRLFGACRERVATYASGGLWLGATKDELAVEAQGFLDQGFRAMKLRVGKPDWREDLERAQVLREAVGPDVALMVDANQGMTAKHAIRLARALEELDIAWFEEPTPVHDPEGHAEMRAAVDTPIASGETVYSRFGIREMIEKKAADVLMPDLQRIGGYTEFRRAAALAHAHNLPVSSHIFTEHSLCLGGSLPNCISVEHMPWFEPLFRERLEIEDGMLVVSERPGVGFTFDPAAVERFRVS